MLEQDRQAIVDVEHLRILSICYVVSAGINGLCSLLGLVYAFMGVFMTSAVANMPQQSDQAPPPAFIGVIFAVIGCTIFAILVGFAALQLLTAKRLKQRRSRVLCMVVAGLTCICVPYGTVLGVFTLLVLSRSTVEVAFDIPTPAAD